MDDTRFVELTTKRDEVGLSDHEADELGEMMAELEGQPYANADTVSEEPESDGPASVTSAAEDACEHLGCACITAGVYCSDFCRAHAEEPTDASPAFDCGCGHDACKAVVGEA